MHTDKDVNEFIEENQELFDDLAKGPDMELEKKPVTLSQLIKQLQEIEKSDPKAGELEVHQTIEMPGEGQWASPVGGATEVVGYTAKRGAELKRIEIYNVEFE